jgi:hypothetical protein
VLVAEGLRETGIVSPRKWERVRFVPPAHSQQPSGEDTCHSRFPTSSTPSPVQSPVLQGMQALSLSQFRPSEVKGAVDSFPTTVTPSVLHCSRDDA